MSLVGAAASAGRYGYLQVSEYGTGTWHDLKLQPQGGNVLISGPVGFNGAAAQSPYASGGAAPAGGVGTAAGGWDTAAHRDAAITLLNNIRAALVALVERQSEERPIGGASGCRRAAGQCW